jgi:hypothetical protein
MEEIEKGVEVSGRNEVLKEELEIVRRAGEDTSESKCALRVTWT